MLAILRCFWTDRAIWVKSFVTLKLLEPLETLAKRAARSAASDHNCKLYNHYCKLYNYDTKYYNENGKIYKHNKKLYN